MLERDVDGKIVTFAKKFGCLVIKLTTLAGHGESGWPDRLFLRMHKFICPHCSGEIRMGKAVFFEMKKTGGKSTPIQERHQELLAEQGFTVYKDIDDPEMGKRVIALEFPREI